MVHTPEQVASKLAQSTNELLSALERQNELQRDVFNARIKLQNARNNILNEYADVALHPGGIKELGSNETAREAVISAMTADDADAVKQLEFQILQQTGVVRIAELKHDHARYLLRILEAETRLETTLA